MLDEISLKILKILQKKARIPNVEVARLVGLAPSAVLERIRKLEKQGIIDGYEVRLNPERFKRNLVAFIFVKINAHDNTVDTGEQLAKIQAVQEVHAVSGEDCYLIKVRVFDTKQLDKVIRKNILSIKTVRSTKTMVVLSTNKETSRIPIDEADLKKV